MLIGNMAYSMYRSKASATPQAFSDNIQTRKGPKMVVSKGREVWYLR